MDEIDIVESKLEPFSMLYGIPFRKNLVVWLAHDIWGNDIACNIVRIWEFGNPLWDSMTFGNPLRLPTLSDKGFNVIRDLGECAGNDVPSSTNDMIATNVLSTCATVDRYISVLQILWHLFAIKSPNFFSGCWTHTPDFNV